MNGKGVAIAVVALILLLFYVRTAYALPNSNGGAECTSNSDCASCGSGDCAGNYKCVSGSCSSTCDSQGKNCGGGNCGSCTSSGTCSLKSGNKCFDGSTQSCTLSITYKKCDSSGNCASTTDSFDCGTQTCSNCKWGTCTKTDNCPSDACTSKNDCCARDSDCCSGSQCSQGQTQSCTKNCTYKICSNGKCVSNTTTVSGTRSCDITHYKCSNYYCELATSGGCSYGTWSSTCDATCPSNACSNDRDCPQTEICNNSKDDDNDGLIDCADPDCWGKDVDNDELIDCCNSTSDCTGGGCFQIAGPKAVPDVCQNCTTTYCSAGASNCLNNKCLYTVTCGNTCQEVVCWDGRDNDNDGLTDCVDPDCAGRNTTNDAICCQKDSDCPAVNNTKGKCDSPYGTDNPDTSGYTYTCYWKPCKSDPECVDGACCVTSTQDSNQANQGKCVSKGIYSNNSTWLCDPPEWHASKTKTQNVFELILDFFSHFFQR